MYTCIKDRELKCILDKSTWWLKFPEGSLFERTFVWISSHDGLFKMGSQCLGTSWVRTSPNGMAPRCGFGSCHLRNFNVEFDFLFPPKIEFLLLVIKLEQQKFSMKEVSCGWIVDSLKLTWKERLQMFHENTRMFFKTRASLSTLPMLYGCKQSVLH